MKIAIVGAAGFIGQMLIKASISEDHELICLDIKQPNIDHSLLESNRITFYQSDSDKNDLVKYIKGVDAVVCLAAIRPIQSFGFKEYATNVKIATNVMDACLELNIKNAVFISSRSVYSDDQIPWSESQSNIAINLYGEAKAAVDQLVLFMNKYYNTNFKSLRLAQVLGLGEVKGYLINTLIDNAKDKKTSVIYGTGCGKKQLIYIKDVISAILKACNAREEKGIYNIGLPESITISDLAKLINNVFDNEGNCEFRLDLPEDKRVYEMSVEKMLNSLQFTPKYTLEDALIDIKKEMQYEK